VNVECKPSQAKVLTEGRRLTRSASRRPLCYLFLLLNALLGSVTDTVTLKGEYAYANDFEVKLRALTDVARTSD
jgi:hypothetical protein